MKRLKALAGMTALALVFSVAACSADAENSATTSIAGSDHVGAAQISIANAEDLWSAGGVDADTQSYSSGRDALNALLGGQADFAAIGDLPAVTAILGGQDLKVVSTLSWGMQWRLLTRGDSGIGDFSQLKGKKVGVTEGTNTQYLLSRILDSAGLTEEDITVVNLAANQIPAALDNSDIDAGVTFPSFYAETQKILGENLREIEYPDYESPTLLVTRSDVDDERIRSVLGVLADAQRRIETDPGAAEKKVAPGSGGGVIEDAVTALWPQYRYGLELRSSLVDVLSDEAQWASASLGLGGDPSAETVEKALNTEPLRALNAGAVEVG